MLSENLNKDINAVIEELRKINDKELCLKKAYNIMIKKYHGERIRTYTRIFDIFSLNINSLWAKNGFLHCTSINYLLKTILIRTALFTEKDIKMKWTLVWYISPHQYLQVKINNKFINIDVWGRAYGIEYGDYAHGFN